MGEKKSDILIYSLAYLVLIALAYTLFFAHIERLPLQIWDEAHRGINAQEIIKNNEWTVITFAGNPDLYGTKPPMLVWIQAFLMKVFGMGELAVRLPSALSGLGTALVLFFGLRNFAKNNWLAIAAVLILFGSYGFFNLHGIRFGDTDGLLTFFSILFLLNYFRFIEYHKAKYLYYAFVFLALATLTKSVAVFMFVPGIAIYTVYKKEFLRLIQNKHFYFGIGIFAAMVGWYYILREYRLPGYLNAVWENEMGGRFLEANDGHSESFWFYIKLWIIERFYFWWILPFAFLTRFITDAAPKKICEYAFIVGISYLLMISSSQTKLFWYDLPLYPILAVMGGAAIYTILTLVLNSKILKNKINVHFAFYVILPLLFYSPIVKVLGITFNPAPNSWDQDFYHISFYLRDQIRNNKVLENCYILEPEDFGLRPGVPFHLSHMMFYANILNRNGSDIRFIPKEQCRPDMTVITNSQKCRNYIQENFIGEEKESYWNVLKTDLIRRKELP